MEAPVMCRGTASFEDWCWLWVWVRGCKGLPGWLVGVHQRSRDEAAWCGG